MTAEPLDTGDGPARVYWSPLSTLEPYAWLVTEPNGTTARCATEPDARRVAFLINMAHARSLA